MIPDYLMMSALRIFLLSLVLVQKVSAQACAIALPDRDVISDELRQLLSSTSGIYYTNLLDFHFTCLASGKVQGTYRSVSLLAYYTAYGNTAVMTIHFAMQCFEDSWSYDEEMPQSSTTLYSTELLSTTKRDCLRCNSDPMNICQVCTSHCNICESSNCCRTCSTSSGFYILAWDNCSCISYAGHLSLLLFIICAIWITVFISILITSLLLQKYKRFIFRGKKKKEVLNTSTDELYDAINESEVHSSGKTKKSLNKYSDPNNQQDTIYEAVDEMESSQHDGDHQDQDISTGHNPSYSTTVQVLNVQPQESENAIRESHPNDEPLEDLTLDADPSYSFIATVPQDYEEPHVVTKRDITESVFEISDNIIDDRAQLHQALPTMTQNVDPNTPEIYEVLDEQELVGSSSEPLDISVGDNPSYAGFKNVGKGPQYQHASTIGTSTQGGVSTLSAAIEKQAMSAHSSDSESKRESIYEKVLQDDEDDYI